MNAAGAACDPRL